MAPTNHRDEVSCGKKAAKKGSKNIHPELLQEMRKMEMMLKFKDQVDVDQVHRDLLLILAKVDRVPPSVRQKIHELLVSLACSNHNAEAAIRFLEAVKETWTPSESAYASVIRVCCERADTAKHALNLLDDFIVNNPNRLRLRTVQPLLYAFMHSRELRSFVDLWKCVLRSHPDLIKSAANSSIEPVEQLFVDVIKAFSEEIGSAEGSEMRFLMENLDEILIEMSETLLSISEKSANFLSSNVLHESCNIVNISSDGHCPISGKRLKLFSLTSSQRALVRTGLFELASGQGVQSREAMLSFLDWMRGTPEDFSVVVDGPNVAYSKQNFDTGCFSYHQIDLVVQQLREEGERVLVLLPFKYVQPVIPNHARHQGYNFSTAQHVVTPEETEIVERWNAEGCLKISPYGSNDDWYWMLSTVVDDIESVRVVTNDQMRDHRLALLDPRPFLRWKTTKIIRFDFSHAWETDKIVNGTIDVPRVTLIQPPLVSPEIQRSTDDEHLIWHFPIRSNVTEAEEEDREYHANPTEAACASTTLIRKTEEERWLCLKLALKKTSR